MCPRRSPISHVVRSHSRNGNPVQQYQRGYGAVRVTPKRLVTGEESPISDTPIGHIDSPVSAELLDKDYEWSERDFMDTVDRPTAFRFIIRTSDDVYEPSQKDWLDTARSLFPRMVESEVDGFKVERVDVTRDLRYEDDNVYSVTVWLRRGDLFMDDPKHWGRKPGEKTSYSILTQSDIIEGEEAKDKGEQPYK